MNAPLSIHGAGHVDGHNHNPPSGAPPSQQIPVQPPRRSFFASVRAGMGLGGDRARPAAPGRAASDVSSLRPPTTGRFSAFFGRYRSVSADQIRRAHDAHEQLRDGSRQSISAILPDSVRERLQQVASQRPDQIFDAVCGLWAGQTDEQAQRVPKAVETLLRKQDPKITLLALESALRKAHRWQTSGQVSARAQAAYAALVGSASAHRAHEEQARAAAVQGQRAGRIESLHKSLDAIGARAGTVADRSRSLGALRAEIASLPAEESQALVARCEEVGTGLRREVMEAIQTQAGNCQSLCLNAKETEHDSRQQGLDALQQAFDTCPGWPEDEHAVGARLLAAAHDDLATWQQGRKTIGFYDGLRDRDPASGHDRAPCKCIAQLLRGGTVADYRNRQGQIDSLCAKAPADQHLAVLAALGVGIRGGDGLAQVTLLEALAAGKREAVDAIFKGAEWDELAGALKRDGLAESERDKLAAAGDDEARQKVGEQFRRERFLAERQQQLRVLNGEVNRLLAGREDLLGDAGKTPEANEAAVAAIRKSLQGLEQDADLLLLNWIYYSSLDAQTLEVDQDKAGRLWAAFGTGREVPPFADVQKQLVQGFRSLGDAARADRMLRELAGKLPASKVLAAASQAQDPRVAARGIARDLIERLCGDGEKVDLEQEAQVEARVKIAVERAKQQAADEQALLPRKLAERRQLFDQLAGVQWKLQRNENDPDLALTVGQQGQLESLLACLDLVAQAEAASKAGKPGEAAGFIRLLQQRAPELAGFDAAGKRFQAAAGGVPGYAQLKVLLPERDQLQTLLNVDRDVERLKRQDVQGGPWSDALVSVMEAATRAAILLEGAAVGAAFRTRGTDDPQGPAKAVLKRLARMGLPGGPQQPAAVREHLTAVLAKMTAKDRDLPKLCKRFDPADPKAKGFLKPAIPGHPDDAGPQGVVARMRGYFDSEADTLRAQNRRAVEERFKALQVGESFALEVGRASQVAGGYSLVPGVSVSAEARGERTSGIHVSRSETGYEIRVVDTRTAGLATVLSLLGETLSARLGRTQARGEGFLFTCTDRGEALRLIEGVAGGAAPGIGQLGSVKVQALRMQASETTALLHAQAALTLPGDQELFKLEAQLAGARGERIEVLRSPFVERQRRTATRTVLVSGGVSVLNGKVSAEAERGYDLSITRDLSRRGSVLTGQQTLAIRARVVDGDARGCLLRVMPHLQDEGALAELDHYLAQVRETQGERDDGSTTELELECTLTPQALHTANDWYRRAEAAGTESENTRHAMEEAERILHDPQSYTPRAVHLVRRSATGASTGQTSYHQSVARVGAEQRLALQALPGAKRQNATLPAAYGALVGSTPANAASAPRLRTGTAVVA